MLVTAEEHNIIGGLGSAVAELVSENILSRFTGWACEMFSVNPVHLRNCCKNTGWIKRAWWLP